MALGEPMSQAEVAQALGLSDSRVGQIEREALRKLRRACERRGIEPHEPTAYTMPANGNRRRFRR